jgi:glycosyltransferase involved in cell wall biosynthesis
MPDILVLSALVPKLLGAKVILDQHDPMPELLRTIFDKDENGFAVRMLRRLEKWSIACADLVITVNLACKRIFSTRSCDAGKIGVVMNTPDENIFPYRPARSYPARNASDPFVMMYHGSLVDRNGLELAVDAVAELSQIVPGVELRVYGRSTAYLEKVLAKARSLGLEDRVRYLGPKTLEELVGEIEACDVGVIPNPRNTFTEINTPTRIFEYLVLGRPVVAPRTTGIQDYFESDALLFFEPGDAKDLARTLAYAVAHPEEVGDLAERGQQVYLRHRWQDERKKLIEMVHALLKKSRRGAVPA